MEIDFDAMDAATLWRVHEFCEKHLPGPLPAAAGGEHQQDEDPDEEPPEQAESDDDESGSDHNGI